MTPAAALSAALDSINSSLSEICSSDYSWDSPRRFSCYAKRLDLILNQFHKSLPEITPSVQTAFKGIAGDLTKSGETLSVYRNKSKIYVLINCQVLCGNLQQFARSIGSWLALLVVSLVATVELRKKIEDLSKEMQHAQFKVTDVEERVYCFLQKEAQGRQTTKAVQSAMIMDLARALGTDSEDHVELAEQMRLLKSDLGSSTSSSERRILITLERIFDNWAIEPSTVLGITNFDFEEGAHIPSFKNFLCPLTKEVMKDPVVLESSQTYERTAIRYWFERCIEDGRDPTCPITGQVLKTLDQKPNIGLAGAIEEWVNWNIEIQIKLAIQYLSEDSSVECIERALDNIYSITEEHPTSRYKVRNARIIPLVIKKLKNCSKTIGSQVRSKALLTMLSMAKDDESKQIMLEEGMARLAIHSLIGSSEREREYAVKLLLDFSSDEGYRTKIALEKGALVLLTSIAGNLEHPSLANLAEEALKNMEKAEENVKQLAAAGRYQPLLTRLCEGTEDVKTEMASLVGTMTLTNTGKELIARAGGKVLVKMLSSKLEAKTASLQALYNLSALDDNATILIDSGVLLALTNILFKEELDGHFPSELKEFALSIISNVVSKPGHWELAVADKEGHLMQSEFIIHRLLELLTHAAPKCQLALLQILYGIASSPQAADSTATYIRSGNGIVTITPLLEHPEAEHRIYAFRITSLLSERLGQDLVDELRTSNKLALIKEKLLDTKFSIDERSEAAYILANIPISNEEVRTVLGIDLVKWIVHALKEQRSSSIGRSSRPTSSMTEGLLGLLVHFVRSPDATIQNTVQEHHIMMIFKEQLRFPLQPKVKQWAIRGLQYLSQTARAWLVAGDLEPQPPNGFCASLMFMCGKPHSIPPTCPLHNASCEEGSTFCLLKGDAIMLLVDLLNDENTNVQIAAVEALSTLVPESQTLERAVNELERLGVVEALVALFAEVRPGDLQEKVLWMIEKILRVEGPAQQCSIDQKLVKALVEAFKHGNPNTKLLAQEALMNLKQLSGVNGKNSNQSRGWR